MLLSTGSRLTAADLLALALFDAAPSVEVLGTALVHAVPVATFAGSLALLSGDIWSGLAAPSSETLGTSLR